MVFHGSDILTFCLISGSLSNLNCGFKSRNQCFTQMNTSILKHYSNPATITCCKLYIMQIRS